MDNDPTFDLFRLIGVVWGGRLWIVLGLAIGALVSGVATAILKPPVYVLQIPVGVWLPARLDNAKGLNEVEAQFPRDAAEIYDVLKIQVPRLYREFEAHQVTRERFDKLQAGTAGASYVPLKLITGGTWALMLEVRLPFPLQDLDMELPQELINSLNVVVAKHYRERMAQIDTSQERDSDPAIAWTKLTTQRRLEEMSIQSRRLALESSLEDRLKAAGLQVNDKSDFVVRATNTLAAAGRLTADERKEVEKTAAKTAAELELVGLRYEKETKSIERAIVENGTALIPGHATEDAAPPHIIYDRANFGVGMSSLSIYHRESKIGFLALIGAIACGLASFSGYLTVRFLRSNRARLIKALASTA